MPNLIPSSIGFARYACRLGQARPRLAIAVVGLWLPWLPAAWASDGIEPIAVSAHARHRGGADVAVGDSALSQIDNPATLSLTPPGRKRFDATGELVFPINTWTTPFEKSSSQVSLVILGNVGVALPVDERLSWGVAFHSKAGLKTRYNHRHLLMPLMERRVSSDARNMSLSVNAAYKLTEKLSVGAGLRGELIEADFNMVLGPADVDFGRGRATGGGFQLGLHYQARPDLAFGLAYRSPSWFGDISGGKIKATLLGLLPMQLGTVNVDEARLPQKITAGVAWDATDWLKLVGEVRWVQYSKSTFHSLTTAIDGPIDLRVPLPLGYKDQWVFITGADVKLDEHWTVSVGYHYGTEPVQASHVLPGASVIVQHHITAGLRYEQANWWIVGGYVLGFADSLRGTGRSAVPLGVDYGHGNLEQTQHAISLGFGFTW